MAGRTATSSLRQTQAPSHPMAYLFVYGTLMPGHAPTCVADLVGRFVPVGRATVGGRLYDLGDYPGLILGEANPRAASDMTLRTGRDVVGVRQTVAGVLVEVPDDVTLLRRLDAYEGFDPTAPSQSLFRRVATVAELADGRTINCQTYVYNGTPAADRRVTGGDWLGRGPATAEDAVSPEPTHCSVEPDSAGGADTVGAVSDHTIIPDQSHCSHRPVGAEQSRLGSANLAIRAGPIARDVALPNRPNTPGTADQLLTGPQAVRAVTIRPQPTRARQRRPMSKRPIIGITTDYSDEKPTRYMLPSDYAASVERAGGLPLLLPFRADLSLVPDYVDLVDGVLFTGGNDLDPALYGDEPWHPMAKKLDPARQRFELALLAEVERRRTPALGVCLGSQLMNVHRGGSLHQFIPDALKNSPIDHRFHGDSSFRHAVEVKPGTVLAEVVGKAGPIQVNSRHKQAMRVLGRGLAANAVAPDGIVEGFEDPSLPLFLAVQWHPENLTAEMPEHLALFQRLVRVSTAARQ